MSSKLEIFLAHICIKPSAVNIDTVSFLLPYFLAHKTHLDFFVRNLKKKIMNECILILVIYWKKTGL